ncbi:condensation domain-containing protein [Pantoea sp. A4]|uniref:condensation domain-containing protein n=1 Tax=Pantoea sp. A4 TaxID=1225184 RepID=UPI00036A5B55|nr:condensation domain-containing protein [Pantoea sp. A4]
MSDAFHTLLSDSELAKLDQAFAAEAPAFSPLSEQEEDLWFRHQQGEAAALQTLRAWHLTEQRSVGEVIVALENMLHNTPAINVGYAFDDEQGIVKFALNAVTRAISLTAVDDESAAAEWLQTAQTQPLALDKQIPLRLLLLSQPDNSLLLGVVLHEIAQLDAATLIQAVESEWQQSHPADVLLASEWEVQAAPVAISSPTASAAGDIDAAISALILAEFRSALNAPEMCAGDDFFDHGGHSLVATRVIGRLLSEHQLAVNINDLFNHPSADALSACAKPLNADQSRNAATAEIHQVDAPLSLAQASLWKVYEAFDHDDIFNLPFAIRFLDAVDEDALRQAFIDVMVRHSVLRSLFIPGPDGVRQQVVAEAALSDYQWFGYSDRAPAGEWEAVLAQVSDYQFDLTRELPLRATFLRDHQNGQQILSLLFHHVVLDEWSLNLLMEELGQAYGYRAAGQQPAWTHQPPPFQRFAQQQHSSGLQQAHLDYWLQHLRGAPVGQPIFGSDQVNSMSQPSDADVTPGWVEFTVPEQVANGLYALARRNHASRFNAIYSGITSALHLLGAPADMLVGTSTSGRNDASYFDTIGYFTTVVAHRIRFGEALTVDGLVNQVRDTINDSLPYSDVPIDLVEEALFGADSDRKNHMFEVFIQIHTRILLNGEFPLQDGGSLAYRQVEPDKPGALLGLQFEVLEEQIDGIDNLRVQMTYRTDHYTTDQAEKIAATVQRVFAAFAAEENHAVALQALASAVTQ